MHTILNVENWDSNKILRKEFYIMAEELQSLLEKIRKDGIDQATAEREKILHQAHSEAENIVAQAQAKAENILSAAAQEAQSLQLRAENAIRQAARDVLLELKSELKKRLEAIVRHHTGEALTPEFMAEIIRDIAVAIQEDPNRAATGTLEIMVAPAKCAELQSLLEASAGADWVKNTSVFANSAAGRGLKISVDGDQIFFDLSDAALTDMVCSYAGTRVSAILAARND